MTELTMEASKRYSPFKYTKSTAERNLEYSPSKQKINTKLHTNRYYCHYPNAVYMGGADSFKKHGHGILFLDTGACALTKHSHDNMIDFNIIFRDKSMTLVTIKTNKSKYVTYRSGPYLLTAHYNQRGMADKTGYLVDFKDKKVYKLTFYASKIDKKQQMLSQQLLQNIFQNSNLSQIIDDPDHLKSLNLMFPCWSQIQCHNTESLFEIGFIDREKSTFSLNGLAFKIKINRNPEEFDVILEERGYFVADRIQKFGEKHFQNGNYYVGGFRNGVFDGYGMLLYPSEQKWVYGVYKKGQLVDLIESSINSKSKIPEIIRKIHQYEDSYIKSGIKLTPTASQISSLFKLAIETPQSPQSIEDPIQLHQRTNNNFTKIRDDFVKKQYESHTEDMIKEELSKEKKKGFRSYADNVPIKEVSPRKRLSARIQQNQNPSPITKKKDQIQGTQGSHSKRSKEKYPNAISPAPRDKKLKTIKEQEPGDEIKMKKRNVNVNDNSYKRLKTTQESDSSFYRRTPTGGKNMLIEDDAHLEKNYIEQSVQTVNQYESPYQKINQDDKFNTTSPSYPQSRPSRVNRQQQFKYYPLYSGQYQDTFLSVYPKSYYDEPRLYKQGSLSRNRYYKYLHDEEVEQRLRLELAERRIYERMIDPLLLNDGRYY